MKVVLAKTIDQVGTMGETKDVKPGYARNCLFPRRLAVLPTDPGAKKFRVAYQEAKARLARQKVLIAELADQWRGKKFTLTARADEQGTLYGSVGEREIKKLLGRDDIDMQVPTLKTVGEHPIKLAFVDGTTIPLMVVIEREKRT